MAVGGPGKDGGGLSGSGDRTSGSLDQAQPGTAPAPRTVASCDRGSNHEDCRIPVCSQAAGGDHGGDPEWEAAGSRGSLPFSHGEWPWVRPIPCPTPRGQCPASLTLPHHDLPVTPRHHPRGSLSLEHLLPAPISGAEGPSTHGWGQPPRGVPGGQLLVGVDSALLDGALCRPAAASSGCASGL